MSTMTLSRASLVAGFCRKLSPLEQALADMGVKPFSTKSVKAYQIRQLRKETADRSVLRQFVNIYLELSSSITDFVTKVLSIICLLLCITVLVQVWNSVMFLIEANTKAFVRAITLALIAALSVCVLAKMSSALEDFWVDCFNQRVRWRRCSYLFFKGVPIAVQVVAARIQARIPDVDLSVEALEADPFLVVSDLKRCKRYYICVWDEGYVDADT